MRKLEDIHYDLDPFYLMNNEFVEALLRVLKKLPEDAYEFAITKIHYIEPSDQMISMEDLKRLKREAIVVISDINEDTIAHEIAHAFLGHTMNIYPHHIEDTHEEKANELIVKWGFRSRD